MEDFKKLVQEHFHYYTFQETEINGYWCITAPRDCFRIIGICDVDLNKCWEYLYKNYVAIVGKKCMHRLHHTIGVIQPKYLFGGKEFVHEDQIGVIWDWPTPDVHFGKTYKPMMLCFFNNRSDIIIL